MQVQTILKDRVGVIEKDSRDRLKITTAVVILKESSQKKIITFVVYFIV